MNRNVSVHGASAAHARVVRKDGRVEHYSSFSRPTPVWNFKGWLWLAQRRIEYKRMEKADGR